MTSFVRGVTARAKLRAVRSGALLAVVLTLASAATPSVAAQAIDTASDCEREFQRVQACVVEMFKLDMNACHHPDNEQCIANAKERKATALKDANREEQECVKRAVGPQALAKAQQDLQNRWRTWATQWDSQVFAVFARLKPKLRPFAGSTVKWGYDVSVNPNRTVSVTVDETNSIRPSNNNQTTAYDNMSKALSDGLSGLTAPPFPANSAYRRLDAPVARQVTFDTSYYHRTASDPPLEPDPKADAAGFERNQYTFGKVLNNDPCVKLAERKAAQPPQE